MGKSTPKAPTPPDPVATAQAQGQMNKETAIAQANLNRINQYTPEGSLVFNQIGTNPDGTPQYESRQEYSPEQMALYQQNLANTTAMSNLANSNISRVQQAQSSPFDFSGMTPGVGSVQGGNLAQGYDTGGQVQSSYEGGGPLIRALQGVSSVPQFGTGPGDRQLQSSYDLGGDVASGYDQGGDINRNYASGGNIQDQLAFNKLNPLAGINDFGAEAKRVQDSVYNQATSRLDPYWQQQQQELASTLAGKGVTENSEAYRRAMDQMTRQRTDAYNQANFSGIQAGSQEQSRLFGLSLAGRQQGASEIAQGGQFANQAQAQREAQNAARAGFGNQAQYQANAQNAALAQFGNQAQAQRNYQNAALAQFGNQAATQGQDIENSRNRLALDAQSQQYNQALGGAQFANQAQMTAEDQAAQRAAFANQAQQQQTAQNAALAAFGNTAQQQQFQQGQANADLTNQQRQQQIAEATYLRNLPIEDVSRLMGMSAGGAQPNFASVSPTSVGDVDYSGLVQNQYNAQMNQYNQQMQQRNAGLGSIFGLAGSALSLLPFSDRRLKHNIVKLAELANGINTYVFSYLGSKMRHFGVMADEVINVRPEAVSVHPSGYMMVDYGKVWQ